MKAAETDEVLATMVERVRPEALAPAPGALVPEDELAATFGLTAAPDALCSRVDGHAFMLLEGQGALAAARRDAAVPTVGGVRSGGGPRGQAAPGRNA